VLGDSLASPLTRRALCRASADEASAEVIALQPLCGDAARVHDARAAASIAVMVGFMVIVWRQLHSNDDGGSSSVHRGGGAYPTTCSSRRSRA